MVCNICKLDYPQQYYRGKGGLICKKCRYKRDYITFLKNPARIKREREKNHKYYRNWYAKNGRNRSYDYLEIINEWKRNNPEKVNAQNKLHYAIKIGKLIKPKKCGQCNEELRLSAHHPDYNKPLKVKWLCSSCHKIIHLTM